MILLLNLKSFFTSNKLLSSVFSVLMIVCLTGGLFGINYAYSNIDYYNKYLSSQQNYTIYNFGLDETEPINTFLEKYSDKIYFAKARINTSTSEGDMEINAIIYQSDIYNEAIIPICGKYLTKDDLNNGSHKILLDSDHFDTSWVGKNINIFGTDYEIIGLDAGENSIPYRSLTDTSVIEWVNFYLTSAFKTAEEKKAFNDELSSIFFGQRIDAPEDDTITLLNYTPMLLPTIILIVLGFINLSFLYVYFIKMREKQFTIYHVCGASKAKVFGIFLAEILLLFTSAYILSILIYNIIISLFFSQSISMFLLFYSIVQIANCLNFIRYFIIYLLLVLVLLIAFIPSLIKTIKSDVSVFGEN